MLILLAVALMTEGGARRDGAALGAGELACACHPKADGGARRAGAELGVNSGVGGTWSTQRWVRQAFFIVSAKVP